MKISIDAPPAEIAELVYILSDDFGDDDDCDCACDCEDDEDDNPDVQVIKMDLNQPKDKLLAELIKKIAHNK